MNCPCKDCTKRYAGCHSKCEEYKCYATDTVNRKEWLKKKNEVINGFPAGYFDKRVTNDKRLHMSGIKKYN